MKVLRARNVNDALRKGVTLLQTCGESVAPRGLVTLEYPAPVATDYINPTECVLFNTTRDANPFFQLFEALWILAGRKDVALLAKFNKQMAKYSDDGESFYGAYGERLRKSYPCGDQLRRAAALFRMDPSTRQVVLAIWDTNDLWMAGQTRDLPCNDTIFCKIRDDHMNITVCCRSNDIIWGAYGTNAVQFSFLLQWLAAATGTKPGRYTQISDSFHAYIGEDQKQTELWKKLSKLDAAWPSDPYIGGLVRSVPLVENYELFDSEVELFCNWLLTCEKSSDPYPVFSERFIGKVAVPMARLWMEHQEVRQGQRKFVKYDQYDDTIDWIQAGVLWSKRRGA